MSSPWRREAAGCAAFAVLVALLTAAPAAGAGTDELPIFIERLPDSWTYCALTDKKSKLLESLSGRPASVFVTDISHGAGNPLGLLVAELQQEYFFWFTWAGLLVGEAGPEDLGALHARSPFRFERCFTDPGGEVMRELGVSSLPTLVLVNEDGYVVDRIEADDAAREPAIMAEVNSLVRSSMLKGRQARDFKLPELRTGDLMTFLDVARKDYTMFLYLHSGSPRCLKGLQALSHLRDRNEESTALVAIFQEPTPTPSIQAILDDAAIEPDVALWDPRAARKDTYRSRYLPVLLIAGRDGTIVYARKGFEPDETRDLIAELEGLLRQGGGEGGQTSFQEARRIYGEALQYLDEGETEMALMFLRRVLDLAPGLSSVHCLAGDACRDLGREREAARHYGRCLAADPRAYDLPEIREKLRSLALP